MQPFTERLHFAYANRPVRIFTVKSAKIKSPPKSELSTGDGCSKKNGVEILDFQVLFCTSFRVLFLLRKSFIETSRFQLYYIRLFYRAKHNITRHQPNITAKQYNSPKANITEKTLILFEQEFFLKMTVNFDTNN